MVFFYCHKLLKLLVTKEKSPEAARSAPQILLSSSRIVIFTIMGKASLSMPHRPKRSTMQVWSSKAGSIPKTCLHFISCIFLRKTLKLENIYLK